MARVPFTVTGSCMYWHQCAELCRGLATMFLQDGNDNAAASAIRLQTVAEQMLDNTGSKAEENVYRRDGRWWFDTMDGRRSVGSWDTFIEAHEHFDRYLDDYLHHRSHADGT